MIAYLTERSGSLSRFWQENKSEYAMFHVRQALKFTVLLYADGGSWRWFCAGTIVVPFIAVIFYLVLFVCRIIAFFSICGGKVKNPILSEVLGFLR